MLPLEIIFYAINESIGVLELRTVDMGGSMFVHTWGAYFGLAVSYMLTDAKKLEQGQKEGGFSGKRENEMFAMVRS